jgi:hypothetical protein
MLAGGATEKEGRTLDLPYGIACLPVPFAAWNLGTPKSLFPGLVSLILIQIAKSLLRAEGKAYFVSLLPLPCVCLPFHQLDFQMDDWCGILTSFRHLAHQSLDLLL